MRFESILIIEIPNEIKIHFASQLITLFELHFLTHYLHLFCSHQMATLPTKLSYNSQKKSNNMKVKFNTTINSQPTSERQPRVHSCSKSRRYPTFFHFQGHPQCGRLYPPYQQLDTAQRRDNTVWSNQWRISVCLQTEVDLTTRRIRSTRSHLSYLADKNLPGQSRTFHFPSQSSWAPGGSATGSKVHSSASFMSTVRSFLIHIYHSLDIWPNSFHGLSNITAGALPLGRLTADNQVYAIDLLPELL